MPNFQACAWLDCMKVSRHLIGNNLQVDFFLMALDVSRLILLNMMNGGTFKVVGPFIKCFTSFQMPSIFLAASLKLTRKVVFVSLVLVVLRLMSSLGGTVSSGLKN